PDLLGPRLEPVRRLGGHLDVRLAGEEQPQPLPGRRLVVGDEHPDHRAPSTAPGPAPSGSAARTRQPRGSRGPARSSPPSSRTRSRIPRRPPPPPAGTSEPAPSSSTVRTTSPPPTSTRTTASPAPACRTTLVSDSCATR